MKEKSKKLSIEENTKETIEEKAKAYDEALSVAQETYATQPMYRDWLAKMFPELKESEDERIRKALIRFHKSTIDVDGIKGDDVLAWLEKQGEQKHADKVESKFHRGDWVVDKEGNIFEITRIDKDYNGITYACRLTENPIFWFLYYEDEIRLWDITKDAKAGDVLIDDIGVILFRKIGNEKYENAVDYHCVVYTDGKFEKQEGLSYWGLSTYAVLHPATKVQRERFFARMHEAGYEWDAERLELKKIEQKPADTWKPSDEQIKELEFFIFDLPKCSVFAQKIIKKGKDTLVSLLSDLKKLREE